MVRAVDIVALGLTPRQVYYRVRKLGLDRDPDHPMMFTQEQVRQILRYKPARSGRKRRAA